MAFSQTNWCLAIRDNFYVGMSEASAGLDALHTGIENEFVRAFKSDKFSGPEVFPEPRALSIRLLKFSSPSF